MADLAVTGKHSFARFRAEGPTLESLKRACAGVADAHLNHALDRAYAVANAIRVRGADAQPTAERKGLGWVAVSGEDDKPYRPVNVPTAPFPQFDVEVDVHGLAGPLTQIHTRYMLAHARPPQFRQAAALARGGSREVKGIRADDRARRAGPRLRPRNGFARRRSLEPHERAPQARARGRREELDDPLVRHADERLRRQHRSRFVRRGGRRHLPPHAARHVPRGLRRQVRRRGRRASRRSPQAAHPRRRRREPRRQHGDAPGPPRRAREQFAAGAVAAQRGALVAGVDLAAADEPGRPLGRLRQPVGPHEGRRDRLAARDGRGQGAPERFGATSSTPASTTRPPPSARKRSTGGATTGRARRTPSPARASIATRRTTRSSAGTTFASPPSSSRSATARTAAPTRRARSSPIRSSSTTGSARSSSPARRTPAAVSARGRTRRRRR